MVWGWRKKGHIDPRNEIANTEMRVHRQSRLILAKEQRQHDRGRTASPTDGAAQVGTVQTSLDIELPNFKMGHVFKCKEL